MVWLSEWGVLKNYAFFYGDFNRSLEGSLSNKFWRPRVDDYWRLLKGVEGAGNPAVLREPYKNIGPPPWNPSKNPRRRFKQEHGEKYFVWCNLFQREANSPRQWRVSDIKHTMILCDRIYWGLLYLTILTTLCYDNIWHYFIYTICSMTPHAPLPKKEKVHTYNKK